MDLTISFGNLHGSRSLSCFTCGSYNRFRQSRRLSVSTSLHLFNYFGMARNSFPQDGGKPTTMFIIARNISLKDVRAHCYCASLVCTLFIRHTRATSFSSARTKSETQQNIELMTFALTWCANIFVGCSVTPTFFSADHFLLHLRHFTV